jgi:hypothetical protein
MEIPKEINNEIWDYCRVNRITNIDDFTVKLIKQGFTVEKFGATPSVSIVEKIVEKVVEVPVEKEIYITDDTELKKLTDKIVELEDLAASKDVEINSLKEQLKNKKDLYGEG